MNAYSFCTEMGLVVSFHFEKRFWYNHAESVQIKTCNLFLALCASPAPPQRPVTNVAALQKKTRVMWVDSRVEYLPVVLSEVMVRSIEGIRSVSI